MQTTFQDLNLSTQLLSAVEDLGFTHPTPVQEKHLRWLDLVKMLWVLRKLVLEKPLPI